MTREEFILQLPLCIFTSRKEVVEAIFSVVSVCLSTEEVGSHVTTTHDTTHHKSHGHPSNTFKLVHNEAQTSVGKQAVGIRLKCLLVSWG